MKATLISLSAVGLLVSATARAELFFDLGLGAHRVESKIANRDDRIVTSDSGLHLGFGARRNVNERSDFGFRLELDTIDSDLFLAVRALDYRRHPSERLAYSVFVGAARLELATPAYGYYFGAGVELEELFPNWNLNVDLRLGDELARDNVLPSDPQGGSPDNFHSVEGIAVYFSRRF